MNTTQILALLYMEIERELMYTHNMCSTCIKRLLVVSKTQNLNFKNQKSKQYPQV